MGDEIDPLKGLAEIINSEVAKEAYRDGASGPLKEVAGFTTDMIKALRWKLKDIQIAASKQDRFKAELEHYGQTIPEDRRVQLPRSLEGPVLKEIEYLDDSDPIRALFQNLLKRAMDKETMGKAHPAFAKLIGQLSPDEALMINYLNPKFTFQYVSETEFLMTDLRYEFPNDYRINSEDFDIETLTYPGNFEVYLDHLISLNLLSKHEIKSEGGTVPDEPGMIVHSTTYLIMLSEFGTMFAEACLPEEEDAPVQGDHL